MKCMQKLNHIDKVVTFSVVIRELRSFTNSPIFWLTPYNSCIRDNNMTESKALNTLVANITIYYSIKYEILDYIVGRTKCYQVIPN